MPGDDPRPGGDRLEYVGKALIRAGVLAIPLMCLAGIFLLTAGTDESFLLLHIRGLVEHGRIGEGSLMHSSHTLSTTGPYTVVASLLSWIGRGNLQVVRLMSVLSLAGMTVVLLRLADRARGRREPDRWLVPASLLIVHGLFLLGSQAYGEVLATTLMLTGILLWAELAPGSWGRRLWTGAVLGMAVASRLNCMPVFAALGVSWLTGRGDRRTEFRDVVIAVGTGLMIFGLQWVLFLLLAHDPMAPSLWRGDFG
ncbi:MAG TPA: hypothetical protein VG457_07835, partial [Planctomycetota bacterium]|nr:hypothetical protein [Planctomycetota bacterium]